MMRSADTANAAGLAKGPKALATLSRSFVELKTLPNAPDMSKLYTEAFLPK